MSKRVIIILVALVAFCRSASADVPQEPAEMAMEGYRLFMRDSLPGDKANGYGMMLSAAWEGDAKAANNIGWLLLSGDFVEKDLKGACRWFERAADQKLPVAALNYVDLLLSHRKEVLGEKFPDKNRIASAAMLAGTALAMGRGLHYDPHRGEELILRAALWGNQEASMTVAQQLEMYPDSFSSLPLAQIAEQCDALLPADERNIKQGTSPSDFADQMLDPAFWYAKIPQNP